MSSGIIPSPHFSQTFAARRRIAACLLRCTAISLLDIVSTMPSSQNRRAPRIQATLRRLSAKVCEKCGLKTNHTAPIRVAQASRLPSEATDRNFLYWSKNGDMKRQAGRLRYTKGSHMRGPPAASDSHSHAKKIDLVDAARS